MRLLIVTTKRIGLAHQADKADAINFKKKS